MWFLKFLKDLISPKKCYSCSKEWSFFCRDCLSKGKNHFPYCYICKKKSSSYLVHETCKKTNFYLDQVIVLSHYKNNTIKKLIKDAKYYWLKDVFEDFWDYLWDLLIKNISLENSDDYIIISSPMFFYKKLKRWYNQADLLSKNISKKVHIRFEKDLVIKKKNTKSQSKLKREERLKNLEWAFKINKKYTNNLYNKTIIIVDDVVSTWATLNEISKILKANKAKKVVWLVISSD